MPRCEDDLQLHEQREVQARLGLSQIGCESVDRRARQPRVAADWRDATGPGEVRHVRLAVIHLEPKGRKLVRHVVERDRRVPRLELIAVFSVKYFVPENAVAPLIGGMST